MTIRQWLCSLKGSHGLLKVVRGRISLICPACGWESNGVTVTLPHPAAEPPTTTCVNRASDPHIMLLKAHARKTRLITLYRLRLRLEKDSHSHSHT